MSDETETHHPAVQLVRADGPADVIAATAAAERAENEHRAPDIKNIFLGGLFLLALLAVCYVAAEIVLPIVVAFVLMLYCSRPCASSSACTCREGSRRC
jgi:hypothetical protein